MNQIQPGGALRSIRWEESLAIGGVLGFLSGMIGIGGGVFLSPILLLSRWADVKRTAAISSAFIVLNSMSGLAGHLSRANVDLYDALPLAITVQVGGVLGSRAGALRLQPRTLQSILGIVLIMAGAKLIGKFFIAAG